MVATQTVRKEPRRVRPVRLCAPEVIVERRDDGTIHLRSPHALGDYPDKLTDRLVHWAAAAPDRVFMAERPPPNPPRQAGEGKGGLPLAGEGRGGCWRTITYAETLERVRRIGAALLRRDVSADRPIVILSGNDLEHALLGLAANYVGIPYAPISPAYSLISSDFGKLKHIFNLLSPGLVFASDGAQYARAIAAVVPSDVDLVVMRNPVRGAGLLSELDAEPPAADAAHAAVGPDTIAKILFTSGSTGLPKGVINTQRMWCSNQAMVASALQFFRDEPPVVVDWAPWHHTAGGNHDVGLVLNNGGTMYIDDGKPLPGAIEATVRNLREIAPTWYFTVPKGYEALLPFFRADAALRENFFSRLKVLWFAGAGLAQHVFDEWKELAHRTCGEDILFLTGLGSTETAPYAFGRMWDAANSANVGLPPPGLAVKLVPHDGKYEARLKGPNITPGYWREPQLTADAFDEEGYYRLGDALRFDDPARPELGLLFEGRLAEDFKLATGTWVSVGPLRASFISHFAPYLKDVVIAGADRDFVAAIVFPDLDACRRLAPDLPTDAAAADIVAHDSVRREFRFLLGSFARLATGSSNRVARAILTDMPPSLDAGEATDKGSINQRVVLKHRAALVDELYALRSARVIAIEETT
jgi:feruloyl-CoA synthase